MGARDNAQLEVQLLAEWWASLPRSWQNKTNVNVGAITLSYNGQVLTPARQRAFGVWNDRVDLRIFTGSEVWIVESKIVGVGGAYGQVLDYCDEYPNSADYQAYFGMPIVPVVVCAFKRDRTAKLFERFGVRTILFTPSWAGDSLANKVFAQSGVA